ncbi:MAG: Crp/Fnr family transcriptional regulator [Cyanobacteriota bacterium]|nr:Crp/Fnr family transcriptional regulator [Cyanobacteriota bacterium]
MMSELEPRLKNQLLTSLPQEDYQTLQPRLEYVDLSLGEVLYQAGEEIEFVYFPENALISLLGSLPDGTMTEFAMIGNEGLVGIGALLGGNISIDQAIVQLADGAWRIDAAILKQEFDRGGVLQKHLLLYIQYLIAQIAQNMICKTRHFTEQRLARWLLSIQDRLQSDHYTLTQKYIAELLNTRRATITEAAGNLQRQGTIRYSRGEITILDRPALEACACECYDILKQEQERLHRIRQNL